jgi:hypothetical protein
VAVFPTAAGPYAADFNGVTAGAGVIESLWTSLRIRWGQAGSRCGQLAYKAVDRPVD